MHRSEPPVVVFSMGKTGSTAIARAVHDATGDPVFQVFRLEPERLAQAERRYSRAERTRGAAVRGRAPPLGVGVPVAATARRERAPWIVITTVREPIAQAVSAFFHGVGDGSARLADARRSTSSRPRSSTRTGPARRCAGSTASSRPALGIDVFDHPFDPTRRLRADRDARGTGAAAAPGGLRGRARRARPVPAPAGAGTGARPERGPRPRRTASATGSSSAGARFPADVLDEVYGSRYARHFYADSELDEFRRRWSGSGRSG